MSNLQLLQAWIPDEEFDLSDKNLLNSEKNNYPKTKNGVEDEIFGVKIEKKCTVHELTNNFLHGTSLWRGGVRIHDLPPGGPKNWDWDTPRMKDVYSKAVTAVKFTELAKAKGCNNVKV